PLRATGATIHDAETTAREVSQTLNKPEGRAVDQWLRSQGFTPMTTSESIAGSDGGGDDIQIPYYQADGTRGTLERAVLQGQDVFGAMIYKADEYGQLVGHAYVYSRDAKTVISTECEGCRIVRLFNNWANCVTGGSLGAA